MHYLKYRIISFIRNTEALTPCRSVTENLKTHWHLCYCTFT